MLFKRHGANPSPATKYPTVQEASFSPLLPLKEDKQAT